MVIRPHSLFGGDANGSYDPLNSLRITSTSYEAPSQRNLGHGQQPRQGQSSPALWTTLPEFRVFTSPANIAYLKREVNRRNNGRIGNDNLLAVMHEQGYLFIDKDNDDAYGPSNAAEIQRSVARMNQRVLERISMLYLSDRSSQSQWRLGAHQAIGLMNFQQATTQYVEDHQVESRWLDE
jgi:hypothetical protein